MSSTAKTEVEDAKQALMVALGDKWAVYLANMKMWFRKKSSKEEFDLESRRLLDRSQTHLHNRFLLAILNKIDAVVPPQSSTANAFDGMHNARPCEDHSLLQQHDGRSGKKRKRSSKSSSERATFAPTPLHEYIASEPASETDLSSGQQQQSVPSIRYAAQELFLPDHGLVLGRLLVGAWENGLASAEDGAVELIVNAVQVLLKNILTATILARKDSRLTGNGTFFYDVGYELKHPFVRNTVTKSKIDDEPMDLDKEITTVSYLKPPPGESLFLAGCEQLYPRVNQKISAYEVYRALQDRNIIPSHSVYSMNIERISSQLS